MFWNPPAPACGGLHSGRAERHAVLIVFRVLGLLSQACADLPALGDEGNSGDAKLDDASGSHATAWKQINHAAGERR